MTKQEEIREGIIKVLETPTAWMWGNIPNRADNEARHKVADKILHYLHSQGAVIKYIFVEPLIKERKSELQEG